MAYNPCAMLLILQFKEAKKGGEMSSKIALIIKNNGYPLKVFNSWWECAENYQRYIKKDTERRSYHWSHPAEYEVIEVRGLKKLLYTLLTWGN